VALGWLEGRLIANWTPWTGGERERTLMTGDALGKLRADARIFMIPPRARTGLTELLLRSCKLQVTEALHTDRALYFSHGVALRDCDAPSPVPSHVAWDVKSCLTSVS
jgi:hypothetical protein